MTDTPSPQSPIGSISPPAPLSREAQERIDQLLAGLEAVRARKGGTRAKPETAIQLVTRYQWEVEELHARNATQAEVCEFIIDMEAECPFQPDTIRKALKAVIPNWRKSVRQLAKASAPLTTFQPDRLSLADTVNPSEEEW